MLMTLVCALVVAVVAILLAEFVVWLGDKNHTLLIAFFILAFWILFELLRRGS